MTKLKNTNYDKTQIVKKIEENIQLLQNSTLIVTTLKNSNFDNSDSSDSCDSSDSSDQKKISHLFVAKLENSSCDKT